MCTLIWCKSYYKIIIKQECVKNVHIYLMRDLMTLLILVKYLFVVKFVFKCSYDKYGVNTIVLFYWFGQKSADLHVAGVTGMQEHLRISMDI